MNDDREASEEDVSRNTGGERKLRWAANSKRDPKPASQAADVGRRLKVLVVDDHRAAAEMLALVVEMLGHETETASDGQMAVELAATFLPDVVLMDIGMPGMDGHQAARHIRQQSWGRSMVLVALTGWGQDEDKREAHDAGFDHHLTKPADPSDLKQLLTSISMAQ